MNNCGFNEINIHKCVEYLSNVNVTFDENDDFHIFW